MKLYLNDLNTNEFNTNELNINEFNTNEFNTNELSTNELNTTENPKSNSTKNIIDLCLNKYIDTKQMNLLVTGGCGFIGSNFINYYFNKKTNFKLVNLDAMYYCANEENIYSNIRSNKNYIFIKGNVCEKEMVENILNKFNINYVIHFAAQTHVQNSFEDSIKFTNDNILGTHNLLECCRKYNQIIKFIHVSTDEVYGESMLNINETHKTEHSILCPTNPYAATKAGAELIAQSYNHSYKMPIIITRGNNVFGPNQYPEKLIPLFIKLLNENKKVTIQGNGLSIRAFLHAYDTSKAFEIILEKGLIGEIYNIGCDEGMEYSVIEIAKILIKMIKNTENYEDWIEYIEDRPYNDKRYYISNKKLKSLGWEIEVDLMLGLKNMCILNKKIDLIELLKMEKKINKLDFFGDWIHNTKQLQLQFINAKPFDHIIIPDFFNKNYADLIYNSYPENIDNSLWHQYNNPIEVKYTFDKIEELPIILKEMFYLLSTDEITKKISELSNINHLEYDPFLHGAGLHMHPTNGRLHVHLDYEKHPNLNKERRLNIILYLNKEWKNEWNGQTELWDGEMKNCVVKSPVNFNTAIIFKTNNNSWHGVPEIIKCPENIFRKTIAYYYLSNLTSQPINNKIGNDGSGYRTKATFTKRPEDEYNENIEKLYKIRPYRLIKKQDLDDLNLHWD